MKIHSVILLVSSVLFFSSCEEIGPVINLTGDTKVDTTYVTTQIETPQQKNVLLEEFTGVRCVNCPAAHELIETLHGQHGSRLIAVSIHSQFQSSPYGSDQNLNVPEADDLWNFLGPGDAKPTGAVDRKLYSGETELLLGRDKWAALVSQQLTIATPVNISIETEFDDDTKDLDVAVTLHYTTEVNIENNLTVMILEDEIITAQLGDGGVNPAYEQNQVLRATLTSSTGLVVEVAKEPGRVVVKRLRKESIPAIWNINNLRVIAAVHQSGSSKNVVHVVEKNVIP